MTRQQGTIIIALLMLIVGYGSMQLGRQAAINFWAQRCRAAVDDVSAVNMAARYDANGRRPYSDAEIATMRDKVMTAMAEACEGVKK